MAVVELRPAPPVVAPEARVVAHRLELTSAAWEMDAGRRRPVALALTAHSSLPGLEALGGDAVRVSHGAEPLLVSLEPAPVGTGIVVRIAPWELPLRPWPVGLRVTALGVTREAAVPSALRLPAIRFRHRLRRYRAVPYTDPLGRLTIHTRPG